MTGMTNAAAAAQTAPDEAPVTVSFTRHMSTDNETQVLAWVHAGMAMAEKFEGFLGTGWVRSSSNSQEWHMLCRFRNQACLDAWDRSPERAWWLSFGADIVQHTRGEKRVGIEGWFDEPSHSSDVVLPGEAPAPGHRLAPPRWKQATMIWAVFFPMSVLAAYLLQPHIASLHVVLRTLIQTSILTPLMTYIMLPFATRVLDEWLHEE